MYIQSKAFMWQLIGKTLCEDQVAVLPTEMQSLLLLLLSSTKITFTDDLSSTKVILILLSSTKVTLTNDPESEEDSGIPSVKYHLQLGDLTVKTELSTNNKNSLLETVRTSFVHWALLVMLLCP